MKNTAFLLGLLVVFALMLCGCSSGLPEGFVKDPRPGLTSFDTHARMVRGWEVDRQDFWDDLDHFWFFDKPTRLNELRIR